MEYRKLPKGSEKLSVLGPGKSSIGAAGERETVLTADTVWNINASI